MNANSLCQIVPVPPHAASFQISGKEVLRWNFGREYPRPYFFPVCGPSGAFLTRMGHPGAPDHDHHQSVWFAHHKVMGIDFWGNSSMATIRQSQWFAYDDGPEFCRMGVELLWQDGHDPSPLLVQEFLCELRPLDAGEFLLELQSQFLPNAEQLEFGQTNFGFLAIRVAKSVSAVFGGGHLTSSTGELGEKNLFGKPASWIDYSGPVGLDAQVEGITCFDHPSNPGFPNSWHVRDDGWFGASPCRHSPLLTTKMRPLILRYLLHVHRGTVQSETAGRILQDFAECPRLQLNKGDSPHVRWKIERQLPSTPE